MLSCCYTFSEDKDKVNIEEVQQWFNRLVQQQNKPVEE
jgi:hypothetical protein